MASKLKDLSGCSSDYFRGQGHILLATLHVIQLVIIKLAAIV